MKQTEDKGKCTCKACGKRFRRLSGFDRHRIGPYRDRRCLTTPEMLERGFREDYQNYWRAPSSGTNTFSKAA